MMQQCECVLCGGASCEELWCAAVSSCRCCAMRGLRDENSGGPSRGPHRGRQRKIPSSAKRVLRGMQLRNGMHHLLDRHAHAHAHEVQRRQSSHSRSR